MSAISEIKPVIATQRVLVMSEIYLLELSAALAITVKLCLISRAGVESTPSQSESKSSLSESEFKSESIRPES